MAKDSSTGEKTEAPTPKKLKEAREEGQVARSQELGTAFTLLASFLVLHFAFKEMLFSMAGRMRFIISMDSIPELDKNSVFVLLMDGFVYIAKLVAPVMLASAIVGALVCFLQVGPLLTPKVILPKFSKINPISGFKRLFSLKALMELGKSLAKIFVISLITFFHLRLAWPKLLTTTQQGFEPALLFIADLIFRVGISVIIFLIILGVIDFIYQKYDHTKNLKMSKYEVKQERKEQEGDPQIKSKRRQKQLQMSLNRMIQALEEADVVITNPTHIAVALKFDIDTMDAPVVVAKGEGYLAQKIKEKAREFEIEIVENKPLARSLNAATEIGDEIPVDLYQAVAEVLAFVFKNNHKY
ncbi:flagellar biosynthesis protein FlhB [Halocella sp. SP3-1]|uniref:flagellar biosynthesis protein FlhB n=1 Tax=Halocella sp. SP3-1 TaxID=2382161 RepID=UPI000F750ABB|nr:flagellar biosynthesis protein FlhB [Halocella sp. SP3-1]AZO94056.1 flagellar biosynthesis protein FlhB [Halocella sp. SP3-1]